MSPSDPLPRAPRRDGPRAAVTDRPAPAAPDTGWVIETIVSPFHCLYQDALDFHTQSHVRLARSEAEASRLARAALLLYVASAEALVRQAAAELAPPQWTGWLVDPTRPLPLAELCQLLPAFVGAGDVGRLDPNSPPWPAFEELLALRRSWADPGPPASRRAYYRSAARDGSYEPLQPHQIPPGLGLTPDQLQFPRTGLPRDPYALRPRHLDTIRGVLDAAIEALDRRLDGALTRNGRHRREPVRVVHPNNSGP